MTSTSRALLATTALVAAAAVLAPAAYADCQPDPAASGQTVTCSGSDTNGFAAPGGVNNLTVNVLSGAMVSTAAATTISLNDGNAVSNAGFITAGTFAGVFIGNGNVVSNSNTGTIAVAGGSTGIFGGNNNTVTNAGFITGVSNGALMGAISVNASSMVTNSGTIALFGDNLDGVDVGVFSTVVNTGAITLNAQGPNGANGVFLNASRLFNSGTIMVSGTGGPIRAVGGNGSTVTNSGRILAIGPSAFGVTLGGTGSVLVNSGTIAASGSGAFAFSGGQVSLLNSGTITGAVVNVNGPVTNLAGGRIIGANGFGALLTTSGVFGQFANAAGAAILPRVTATAGTFDTIVVSANASLAGSYVATVQPGLYGAITLDPNAVQVGGTRTGAFDSVASSSAFLTASLTPGAGQNLDLTLTRIGFGAVAGETQNQQAVGNALNAQYSTGATGNAATLFGNLFAASSTSVLDALSGEVGTGVQNPSFAMGDAFYGTLLGQVQRWRAGQGAPAGTQSAGYRVQIASARPEFGLASSQLAQATPGGSPWPPASVGPHWAAWASGFGLSGNRDGDGAIGSARLSYSMGGAAAGADFQIAPSLLAGAAVGAAGSDFSLDGRSSSGNARTFFFGLYGSWTMGPLYVDAAASYGHGEFTTTRTIAIPNISERATGEFDGNQYGGRIEAGWRFMVQRYELTPFVGVTAQALHQNGYSESTTNLATNAPGILGLSYQDQTTTSVRSFVGGQATTTFNLGEHTTLMPRIRVAWGHEFNANRQVNASFLSIPGAAFTVSGARPARDAAIVGAGVDLGIGRNVALYAQFDGDLSGRGNAYAGTGGIRFAW